MSSFIFDGSVLPVGEEWPAGVLPPTCLVITKLTTLAGLNTSTKVGPHPTQVCRSQTTEPCREADVCSAAAHLLLGSNRCLSRGCPLYLQIGSTYRFSVDGLAVQPK